ncbi:hypothetical protein JKP88DRAFT_245268 [Tribonema minus]|uniref:Uncharacterized protein n=1 Tax=Tribonema minus TaxID=303371 RepID=A0A835Z6Z0_9STRA|nr:hypothetical protein JKP88DRAFT_245268 [Tribonema minus]
MMSSSGGKKVRNGRRHVAAVRASSTPSTVNAVLRSAPLSRGLIAPPPPPLRRNRRYSPGSVSFSNGGGSRHRRSSSSGGAGGAQVPSSLLLLQTRIVSPMGSLSPSRSPSTAAHGGSGGGVWTELSEMAQWLQDSISEDSGMWGSERVRLCAATAAAARAGSPHSNCGGSGDRASWTTITASGLHATMQLWADEDSHARVRGMQRLRQRQRRRWWRRQRLRRWRRPRRQRPRDGAGAGCEREQQQLQPALGEGRAGDEVLARRRQQRQQWSDSIGIGGGSETDADVLQSAQALDLDLPLGSGIAGAAAAHAAPFPPRSRAIAAASSTPGTLSANGSSVQSVCSGSVESWGSGSWCAGSGTGASGGGGKSGGAVHVPGRVAAAAARRDSSSSGDSAVVSAADALSATSNSMAATAAHGGGGASGGKRATVSAAAAARCKRTRPSLDPLLMSGAMLAPAPSSMSPEILLSVESGSSSNEGSPLSYGSSVRMERMHGSGGGGGGGSARHSPAQAQLSIRSRLHMRAVAAARRPAAGPAAAAAAAPGTAAAAALGKRHGSRQQRSGTRATAAAADEFTAAAVVAWLHSDSNAEVTSCGSRGAAALSSSSAHRGAPPLRCRSDVDDEQGRRAAGKPAGRKPAPPPPAAKQRRQQRPVEMPASGRSLAAAARISRLGVGNYTNDTNAVDSAWAAHALCFRGPRVPARARTQHAAAAKRLARAYLRTPREVTHVPPPPPSIHCARKQQQPPATSDATEFCMLALSRRLSSRLQGGWRMRSGHAHHRAVCALLRGRVTSPRSTFAVSKLTSAIESAEGQRMRNALLLSQYVMCRKRVQALLRRDTQCPCCAQPILLTPHPPPRAAATRCRRPPPPPDTAAVAGVPEPAHDGCAPRRSIARRVSAPVAARVRLRLCGPADVEDKAWFAVLSNSHVSMPLGLDAAAVLEGACAAL